MDERLTPGFRAQRHRLLGDTRRLAIVEALGEGPRQIPELSRLLGIHPTTVRAHLEKLLEAGMLEEVGRCPRGTGPAVQTLPAPGAPPRRRPGIPPLRREPRQPAAKGVRRPGRRRRRGGGTPPRPPNAAARSGIPRRSRQPRRSLDCSSASRSHPPRRCAGTGASASTSATAPSRSTPVNPTAPSSAPSTRASSVAWPRSPPGRRSPCGCRPSWRPACAGSSSPPPTSVDAKRRTELPGEPQNRTP